MNSQYIYVLYFLAHNEDFDIQCTRETTVDVTSGLDFPCKPPQETQLNIADISKMPSRQSVLKLNATISSLNKPSTMMTIRDTESEVKSCRIGDQTGMIQLSLWDNQIDMVKIGTTYEFTNLSTRTFSGKTYLTTTRNTKITQQNTAVLLPTTSDTEDVDTQTNTITQTIEGSTISMKKLCPKCHSTQLDFNTKLNFHRCTTCKILRKQESYISKCNGTLIFKLEENELSLTIANSVLTRFIRKQNTQFLDAQDIEEFLLTCGPVTVTYTDENHVIEINKSINTIEVTSTHDIDDELCTVTDLVSFSQTSESKVPGDKRNSFPTQHIEVEPKQTKTPKDH
ncbi:uncharacterized protein LOC113089576 [Carassius auratus]|uniref:Uncharacterized protein LOC113089576 n=1 Tax=Carassius auratus TaxID=7957 RepID=A0A6P6NTB5_CARAU|nr:uncharacterized protein LOC113089576 [Carassius auratus]